MAETTAIRIKADAVRRFIADLFQHFDVIAEDAYTGTDVLYSN